MMPELGKYAIEVLSAYGATLVLMGALIWRSVARYTRTRDALDEQERRNG